MERQPASERSTNSNCGRREEWGGGGGGGEKEIDVEIKRGEVVLMIFCTILRIS